MTQDPADRHVKTGVAKWCLLTAGLLLTVLAVVGAFLPVLPTTPFLLLAAACFARSSTAFHRCLLDNRLFGSYIEQWERERTIPPEARRKAYGLLAVTFAISIVLVGGLWLRLMLAAIGGGLVVFLASLPTAAPDAQSRRESCP
ncbi:MAG: uncharacterized membrane protein YbaN (DUF454 family) [Chlamydiales bacterium]|jgi:uncharacterized membrane protein YbaN (DUF454 family)